jgi:hypothetical protein
MKRCESVSLLSGRGSGYGAFMLQHMPENMAAVGAMISQANRGGPWDSVVDSPLNQCNAIAVGTTGYGKICRDPFMASLVTSPATGDRQWISFGNASCTYFTPSEDSHAR